MLILHGLTAYSGPYSLFAEPLTAIGFTVYGLDLRGHGLSDGNRGDTPSKERFVKDICETIEFMKEQHEKVVLLGHSLGVMSSLLAMNDCLKNISGSVLLSAGVAIRPGIIQQPSAIQKLKILFSSIFSPSKPVIEYRREGMTGLDDPLFTFKYTLRFLRLARSENIEIPEEMDFPVFVGVGDSDELFTVESSKELYEMIPSDSKKFYVAEGARHAVFPDGVWNPLITWVDKQFS
jgi:alpha-beta hydrolase superfamily lysophospholipase